MKSYLKVLLILILVSSFPVQANIFSYISKVENSTGGIQGRIYIGKIERWTLMPGVPNPCYNDKACKVYLSHRHYDNGTAGIVSSPKIDDAYKYKTMDDLREAFLNVVSLPYEFRTAHGGKLPTIPECVGLFYGEGKMSSDHLLPGSVCGTAPTANQSCDFEFDNIDFIYNDLAYNDVLNNNTSTTKQTKSVKIQCNYAANVIVSAVSDNSGAISLNKDDSLKSYLKINNKPANGLIELPITTKDALNRYSNTFSLSSEIKNEGKITPGPFNGSSVVIIVIL